jgi:hypothetical protein
MDLVEPESGKLGESGRRQTSIEDVIAIGPKKATPQMTNIPIEVV